MASTAVTLYLDEHTVASAKQFAQYSGKSLSEIVDSYLRSIDADSRQIQKLSPTVRKLIGIGRGSADSALEYKEYLRSRQ